MPHWRIIQTFSGGAGNDVLNGGLGNDTLDGGTGVDAVVYGGTVAVRVNLVSGIAVGGQGTDTLMNISQVVTGGGNDVLVGDNSGNTLSGGDGNDTISGWGGADRIVGGAGTDLMQGGAGDDITDLFVFAELTHSGIGGARDVIEDFVSGIDRIDLGAIDTSPGASGDQDFVFGGTTAKAYGVWYVTTTGGIVIRADINGNTTADMEILLKDVTSVTGADFVL